MEDFATVSNDEGLSSPGSDEFPQKTPDQDHIYNDSGIIFGESPWVVRSRFPACTHTHTHTRTHTRARAHTHVRKRIDIVINHVQLFGESVGHLVHVTFMHVYIGQTGITPMGLTFDGSTALTTRPNDLATFNNKTVCVCVCDHSGNCLGSHSPMYDLVYIQTCTTTTTTTATTNNNNTPKNTYFQIVILHIIHSFKLLLIFLQFSKTIRGRPTAYTQTHTRARAHACATTHGQITCLKMKSFYFKSSTPDELPTDCIHNLRSSMPVPFRKLPQNPPNT